MKINITDTQKITNTLDTVNGTATTHTFTTKDLWEIRKRVEKHLQKFQVLKSERRFVAVVATSGDPLPRAYKQQRVINRARLEFSADGSKLYLTGLDKFPQWPNKNGHVTLVFTLDLEDSIQRRAKIAARTVN